MSETTKQNRMFPTWEQIGSFKNPLTEGELVLAQYLDAQLPAEWEILSSPI